MGELSNKLRSAGGSHGWHGIMHWCPGCDMPHVIWHQAPKGPTWEWNHDVLRPTCSPSILNFTTHDEAGKPLPNNGQRTLCHYFLTDGNIVFCGDSAHRLAGQTVPLPDWPRAN